MSEETPKLDKLIAHTPLGRILKKDGLEAEFALIRQAFTADGREVPEASKFRQVGEASRTKADGVACASPKTIAAIETCPNDQPTAACSKQRDDALASGECIALAPETDAIILAGSHSFDWVRLKIKGHAREWWAARHLVLD